MRQTILITGASSGLGEGMAREFAKLGRNLALCARRVERLQTLKAELQAAHPGIRISVRALDVTQHEQVFAVFQAFAQEFGTLDRVIVNAGQGKGQPVGTGGFFQANLPIAQTNFVAALAQCEAAMDIFRKQNDGHLVVISSMSAMRGLGDSVTAYAASKAGISALAEGLRVECLKKHLPIAVTTIHPGYITTEMTAASKHAVFMVDTEVGCRAIVQAIEREPAQACAPVWPWRLIGLLMRNVPLPWVARFF